jgi:putative peptide zinc metalloprotease protein
LQSLINKEHILKYDNLAVKEFYCNDEKAASTGEYILSFEERHIKVSRIAKAIVEKFDGKSSLLEIAEKLNAEGINCSSEDIRQFVDKILIPNGLLVGTEGGSPKGTNAMLWARLPIVESKRFEPIFKVTHYLFNKWLVVLMIIILTGTAIFNVFNIITADHVISRVNTLFIIFISYLSLALHEIGHASAAYHYNVKCGKMGIGMYLFSLVFFVDVSNTWKLDSKKRIVVDFGGVYYQLLITVPLMVAAIVNDDVGYSVAAISITLLTATNLLPFLKLDGYWILVDWLHVDNLSVNAYKVVRRAITGKVTCSRSYLMCSIIYVISFIAMMGMAIYSIIKVIVSRKWIIDQINELSALFSSGRYSEFFGVLNNLIIFLVPLLFLVVMLYKVSISVLKGVVGGMIRVNHGESTKKNT